MDKGMTQEVCGKAQMPCREKYWSELMEHEKIERMRQQVKMLQAGFDRAMTMITKLTRHNHVDDKVVLIEDISGGYGYGYYGDEDSRLKRAKNPDEVYF